MNGELAVVAKEPKSLIEVFAGRYQIEPGKLMAALKATAFRQSGGAEISNEQMVSLLVVANQYKLNPFTKEIFAFPDKGGIVPVVGVDGWSRIINEHPQFDGMDFVNAEDGSSCTCIIHRKDRSHPVTITEYLSEVKRDTHPWKSHPRRMLRHKAIIQCARIAFGFAGIYDEDEAERIVESAPPTAGYRLSDTWDELPEETRTHLSGCYESMQKRLAAYDVSGAVDLLESFGLQAEESVALWSRFDSKQRSAIKREQKSRQTPIEPARDLDAEAASAIERDK